MDRCGAFAVGILSIAQTPRVFAALSLAMTGTLWAYENGAPPGHTGGFGEPTCVVCHFDNDLNSIKGEIGIDGMPETYVPGTLYEFSVVVKRAGLRNGGFQLIVRNADGRAAGDLSFSGIRVQATTDGESGRRYAVHNKDGSRTEAEGRISWLVRWRAPSNEDEVVINVAANAANDDASPFGDYIYLLEKRLGRDSSQVTTRNRENDK